MTKDKLDPILQEMRADIKTNHVGGLVQLDHYAGSDLNLTGWTLTSVIDDVLLVTYADSTDDGKGVMRGGIVLPTNMSQNVWRIGKVLLAGPAATVKAGEFVMFPNDKGLQAKNVNGNKSVVFLNQQRIFGIVKPTE